MTLLFVYLAIAIGVSFMCSVLEAVLLSITPSFIEKQKLEKPGAGMLLVSVKEKLDESLSSILILNTFAHTVGAVGVGSQAVQVFGAYGYLCSYPAERYMRWAKMCAFIDGTTQIQQLVITI